MVDKAALFLSCAVVAILFGFGGYHAGVATEQYTVATANAEAEAEKLKEQEEAWKRQVEQKLDSNNRHVFDVWSKLDGSIKQMANRIVLLEERGKCDKKSCSTPPSDCPCEPPCKCEDCPCPKTTKCTATACEIAAQCERDCKSAVSELLK